jgi:hypothetical protein
MGRGFSVLRSPVSVLGSPSPSLPLPRSRFSLSGFRPFRISRCQGVWIFMPTYNDYNNARVWE